MVLSCFMVSIVATIMSLRNSTRNLHVYKACRQPKLISLSVHLTSLVCRIFLSFWPRVPLHKVVYIDLDPSFWDKVQASISKSFISLFLVSFVYFFVQQSVYAKISFSCQKCIRFCTIFSSSKNHYNNTIKQTEN